MADATADRRVALLASSWGHRHDEAAFVARAVAGGLSRLASVDILVPGLATRSWSDGAFDPFAIGEPTRSDVRWPAPTAARFPSEPSYDLVVMDRSTAEARSLIDRHLPGIPVVAILPEATRDAAVTEGTAALGVGMAPPGGAPARRSRSVYDVGLHVAVNPLAAERRHAGIGFTDYLLVLTDRRAPPPDDSGPTPLAAWLVARFTRPVVVVVEDAVASVWRSRSLLGRIAVDTRTDLWRLMAHAAVTVDLDPGPYLARECVESLRFGVPIVVPAGTAGHRLAAAGGGLWYRGLAELFASVEALLGPETRHALARQGQARTDRWYGDPAAFVDRLKEALAVLH